MGTMKVFVLIYTHKHGYDVSVYQTQEKAETSALDLIMVRASESWDQASCEELDKLKGFADRHSMFCRVEMDTAYGECIEIEEREVG